MNNFTIQYFIVFFVLIIFIGYVSIKIIKNKESYKELYLIFKYKKNGDPVEEALVRIKKLRDKNKGLFNKMLYFFSFIIYFDFYKKCVRESQDLGNGELIKLRYNGKDDYYEYSDPGLMISLPLFIAHGLYRIGLDYLKSYTTKRICKNPNDLYQRLFLAFYHIYHNKYSKALTEFKEIREINNLWHYEFIGLMINKLSTKGKVIPFKKPEK